MRSTGLYIGNELYYLSNHNKINYKICSNFKTLFRNMADEIQWTVHKY